MILKDLKKRFAVAEYNDLGLRLTSNPLYPALKNLAYVTEFVMRRKTTGKRLVRFRVYSDEWVVRNVKLPPEFDNDRLPQIIREVIEQAALFAVRQVLDQL